MHLERGIDACIAGVRLAFLLPVLGLLDSLAVEQPARKLADRMGEIPYRIGSQVGQLPGADILLTLHSKADRPKRGIIRSQMGAGGVSMRRDGRVMLLVLVAVIVIVLVLGSAFQLLPPPPGSPTPTAPTVLDRPEGLPRIQQ